MTYTDADRDRIIEDLLETGAVKFGNFTLSSGATSSYYVDVKLAACNPFVLGGIARALVNAWFEYSHNQPPKLWAGVELGGIPLSVACSIESGIPHLIVRKQVKGYGQDKLIEGVWSPGDTVVLVEDVTTTGASAVRAYQALVDAGLNVLGIMSVVDRQQGGEEAMKEINRVFLPLVTAAELLTSEKITGPKKSDKSRYRDKDDGWDKDCG